MGIDLPYNVNKKMMLDTNFYRRVHCYNNISVYICNFIMLMYVFYIDV